MKLSFNNFAKVYFLISITGIGWIGGGQAYYIGFKLLELMIILMSIIAPVMAILWYASLKILLHFKPNAGFRGDAKDIVWQMESSAQGLKECIKHPFETLLLILMNIVAFLKS